MNKKEFKLQELINDPSFIRWATGQAGAAEADRWNAWTESDENNRQVALQAQKRITGISFETPAAVFREEDWKQVERQILSQEKSAGFRPSQIRTRNTLAVFLKIAAVFLIVAISGGIVLYTQETMDSDEIAPVPVNTVKTGFSEKKTISLSDGSEIILAAGSSLSYRENWLTRPTLRVSLLKGEAFFSIRPDADRDRETPRFEVQTEDGITAVMGTRFSVSTYGEGTRVVLEEGEVRVTAAEPGEPRVSTATLTPGEMAQWTKGQSGITMSEVNPRVYTSWASDQLFFDETPVSHLVQMIERTYGVEVEVENPGLLELRLSGAVDFYSLEALTYAVSEVLDLEIKQTVDQRILLEKQSSEVKKYQQQ